MTGSRGSANGSRAVGDPDSALIDEALGVLADARARLPRDFLFGIAGVLVLVAIVLVALAWLASGVAQDLLLNLGAEVVGALITVVVIDGLWRRRESAASASLDRTTQRLAGLRGAPLTDAERGALADVRRRLRSPHAAGVAARSRAIDAGLRPPLRGSRGPRQPGARQPLTRPG